MNYDEYLKCREALVEENSNMVGNVLSEKEEKLNALLDRYRYELITNSDLTNIYKMPLLRSRYIQDSSLYSFAKRLPKGSDLHVHATALIPAWKLIDFVVSRPELVVDIEDGHIYNEAEEYDKAKCMPLQVIFSKGILSKDDVINKWSFAGLKHGDDVWEYFENILCIFESIEYDLDTLYAYYVFAFRDYLKSNIHHIEIHALFSDVYEKTVELAKVIRRAYYDVKKENPDLIVSVICAGLKYDGIDLEVPKVYLYNALKLREEVIDDYDPENTHPFIIGFDLLNEEDRSVPLKDLAPMLLECSKEHPDFNFYLHCGESLDAQSNNLIDAYLLGATRVGHGMNLYKFPNLLQRYADKEICLEACLISNQTLKYVKDLRLHPGAEYLKRGVIVALCSDDPVCQEWEQLTDDFVAAIIAWKLNIADIKQLCINSILYSGVDKKQKSELITSWKNAWDQFVEEVLNNN